MRRPKELASLKHADPWAAPPGRMTQLWPDRFVWWDPFKDREPIGGVRKILNQARDERPLQRFLGKHPHVFALAFGARWCWLFAKPRLGGGTYIPDFLFCDRNSLGYAWTIIELESPRIRATTRDESVSHRCHHAVEQILDYRRWLRDNLLFEEKQGFAGLHAYCNACVVIGRRDDVRTELEAQRLADFRQQKIEIMSYDRLFFYTADNGFDFAGVK